MDDLRTADDGLPRCGWVTDHAEYRRYHDEEWGVPLRGERALFEKTSLEAFQSGLSWLTILRRRDAFRRAFADFDPDIIATWGHDEVERLVLDDGIIRNRAKITAVIGNARATVDLRDRGGLHDLVWSHAPKPRPRPRSLADIPSSTDESRALSAALRAEGFRFVGPTTAYALMQAGGLVDDHIAGCHRAT